jgi:hypothetical protein
MKTDPKFAVIACVVALIPVGINVAAGGLHYTPTASGNPCDPYTWKPTHSTDDVLSQAAVSALDGAACKLNVSSETLGLALSSQSELDQFQREQGLTKSQIDDAARAGLLQAVDDGERSGQIGGIEAFALRLAARAVPVDRLLELVRDHLYG